MLSRLNKLGHPHLVKLLATYKLLGRYHFVFPYAPANLRTHWDYVDMPYWNNDTYLWFLAQIRGLVSALRAIHDFGTGDVRLSSQQGNERTAHFTGRPSTHLKVVRDEQVFGRHGDLKPENILWSDDGHGGVLEITDLGLGRFHQLESRSRVDPRTVNGSPTYTPPEISLEIDVSRAYDIWSIGCVFLGFVSWLLEGSKAMYNFSDFRMGSISEEDEIEDDTFYSIRRRTDQTKYAIVRDGVDQWIERLKSNPRCSPMVLDLIQIIQEEMIVVEVDRRITAAGKARAEGLDAKMQRILEKGRANTEYLLGKSPPASQRDMGIKKPWKLTHQPPPDLHGVQFQVDGRPVNGS
jgi:serine/threonine protein kinase